jgi:hypothetical protein
MIKALKVKLEMAKFLQQTLNEMACHSKGHSSQSAKEFAQFFEKVPTKSKHIFTFHSIKKYIYIYIYY